MDATPGNNGKRGLRILFAGTGGQGVLTAARFLGEVLVELGHDIVSGQLHGMAQRGGAVQSSVLVDAGISPVIASGRADFVVGLEPVETARALPLMSAQTVVYMNTAPILPFVLAQRAAKKEENAEYPDVDGLVEAVRAVSTRVFALDATQAAIEAGAAVSLNMVMLGCLLGSGLLPTTADEFWMKVQKRIPSALLEVNERAYRAGARFADVQEVTAETR